MNYTYTETINGITVYITEKKVTRFNLRVNRPECRVTLSVPFGTKAGAASAFLGKNLEWIESAIERTGREPSLVPSPDGTVLLWGRELRLAVSPENGCPRAEDGAVYLRSAGELDGFYARELLERAEVLVKRFEALTGLEVELLRVRKMKSRWGSCVCRERRITLSLRLALYPPECLEYVVLHEMAHIVHPDHQKGFYDFIRLYMPDFRERETILKARPFY